MAAGLNQAPAAVPGPASTPASASSEDGFEQIEKLHKLLQMGAITQGEFDAKKAALLARMG
jgi:hypothetical protein